jgi:drug/metabolite transporter (DMT)-like permease
MSESGSAGFLAAAISLAYQGIVIAGFCFLSWAWLMSRYQASKLAALAFFTPPCGVLISHWVLGDALGPGLWLGTLLVGAGVAVATAESR